VEPTCPADDPWPATPVGQASFLACGDDYDGWERRDCGERAEWGEPVRNCTSTGLVDILTNITLVEQGLVSVEEEGPALMKELSAITSAGEGPAGLLYGDVRAASGALQAMARASEQQQALFNREVTMDFLTSASNLLDSALALTWQRLQSFRDMDSSTLIASVESFTAAIDGREEVVKEEVEEEVEEVEEEVEEGKFPRSRIQRQGSEQSFVVRTPNIVLMGTHYREDAGPAGSTGAYAKSLAVSGLTATVDIDADTIADIYRENMSIASVAFGTLAGILPLRLSEGLDADSTPQGIVLSTVVNRAQPDSQRRLTLTLPITNNSVPHPEFTCVFWDFALNNSTGGWSGQGCRSRPAPAPPVTASAVCACDHTTSFSVLVSPGDPPGDRALHLLTYAGLGLSVASLAAALATQAAAWPSLRGENSRVRHALLVNVCASLLSADVWFLVGSWAAEAAGEAAEALCTAATFMAHLSYLSLFSWMLAEGLFLHHLVVTVFPRLAGGRRLAAAALALGYGCPAVIAGVTAAVAAPRGGYRGPGACWLAWGPGKTLLAFAVPAAAVVAVNSAVFALVLVKVARRAGGAARAGGGAWPGR
ncbi:adhesion G-protein coupled receptor F3-like, partial [Petromyzon marinus]|uniref:adhesion G-protein coupled receptor F3-like n=1 Tax=Petromyzon marinus TaxID=7757 RepID=UPI003F721F1A